MSARRVLAQGEVTRVEVCPCGACYLTIGPITMCLQSGVLGDLGASIAKAVRMLRAEEADGDRGAAIGHVCHQSEN